MSPHTMRREMDTVALPFCHTLVLEQLQLLGLWTPYSLIIADRVLLRHRGP